MNAIRSHVGEGGRAPPVHGMLARTMSLRAHWRVAPGGRWPYWRWVLLRSAGFPYASLERLRVTAAASAADRLLDTEEELAALRVRLVQALEPLGGTGDERVAERALRRLREGR